MIIFRYLSREVLNCMLAMLIILLLIFLINFFTNYMDNLTNGQITLVALLKIIAMQVPLLLGYLLPLSLFLGILVVYARLSMQHEMVVLYAGGFSRGKLYAYTLGYGLIIVAFIAILMMYVEPIMQKYRLQLKAAAFAEATIAKVVPKQFIDLGDTQGYLYANAAQGYGGRLQDVFWARQVPAADAKSAASWDLIRARWADEESMPGVLDHYMVFHDGSEYVGVPGKRDLSVSAFSRYGVRLQTKIGALANPIKFTPSSLLWSMQRHNRDAKAELQWRLAVPISALLLIFIAVYLAQVNPRRAKFIQLIPAVLLYILYMDLLFVARNHIENGSWLGRRWGMWWVHGLFLALLIFTWLDETSLWRRMRQLVRRLSHKEG